MADTTGTPTPVIVPAIPWYRSPIYNGALIVVLGAVTTLAPRAAAALHLDSLAGKEAAIEVIGAGLTLLGGAFIWALRQFSKIAPVTFDAKAAAEHINTKAVVATQAAMMASGVPTGAVTKDTMLNDPTQAAKDAAPPAASI